MWPMPHSYLEERFIGSDEKLVGVVWRWLDQKGQSSSAGAAIKGFNRVGEIVF